MKENLIISDLNSVESSTSQLPLVGYTVFWRLAGIRVSHHDLEQSLQTSGFSNYLPEPPTPRVALRRALAQWIKEKQQAACVYKLQGEEESDENSDHRQRTLIRVINRAGSEHLVYALVAEDVDFNQLGLTYGTALRILLHKKTGAMICTTEADGVIDAQRESQQVAAELAPYWQEYRDLFIARDLSQMMREIVNGMSAINLRRAGGLYFVPVSERDSLIRLRQLIAGIPQIVEQEPFVCALGVPDAVETRRSLVKAVHAGLLDEINSLHSDLQRIGENGERVREKTITQRFQIYQRLKSKAEMYRDLLGMQKDQVRASIQALETEARRLLTLGELSFEEHTENQLQPYEAEAARAAA